MNLSLQDLQAEASATGFPLETLDKVIRLIELLNAFRSHPFLKDRMVLKGGTALNLFVFDLPRLSVDIDLNYVGVADREVMLAEKEKVEQAISAICGRGGYTLRRVPTAHAGGKWRLGYTNALDRNANLEIDVVFTLRIPLWSIQLRVLSHNFFSKEWPQLELDALVATVREGERRVLPVWHEITEEEVKTYSPLLSGLIAAKSSQGIEAVVAQVVAVCRPD